MIPRRHEWLPSVYYIWNRETWLPCVIGSWELSTKYGRTPIRMSTFRFFRTNDSFFSCGFKKIVRFDSFLKRKICIKKKKTLSNSKFCFSFCLFIQKVKANWNLSFGHLISSESKLYLPRFYDWAQKKTIRIVSVLWIKYFFPQ